MSSHIASSVVHLISERQLSEDLKEKGRLLTTQMRFQNLMQIMWLRMYPQTSLSFHPLSVTPNNSSSECLFALKMELIIVFV